MVLVAAFEGGGGGLVIGLQASCAGWQAGSIATRGSGGLVDDMQRDGVAAPCGVEPLVQLALRVDGHRHLC